MHCSGLGCTSTELCASHPTTPSAVSTRSHGAPPLSAPVSITLTEAPTTSGAACRLPPAGGLRSYPGSLLPAGALTTGLKRPAFDRSLMPSCAITAAAITTGLSVWCSAGRGATVFVSQAASAGTALPKLRTCGPVAGALEWRRPTLDGALRLRCAVVEPVLAPAPLLPLVQ
jgi:hypothetical protein